MKSSPEESIGFIVKGDVRLAEPESTEITGESTTLLTKSDLGAQVEIIPEKSEQSSAKECNNDHEMELHNVPTPEGSCITRTDRVKIICCTANFISLCCVSLQAPFYPKTVWI